MVSTWVLYFNHHTTVSAAAKKLYGVKQNRTVQSLLNVTPLNKKKESDTSNQPAGQSDSTPMKMILQ
mgnify:CR=1 FL=1